jgi:ABC-type uncharacterized transport system permease subunit
MNNTLLVVLAVLSIFAGVMSQPPIPPTFDGRILNYFRSNRKSFLQSLIIIILIIKYRAIIKPYLFE